MKDVSRRSFFGLAVAAPFAAKAGATTKVNAAVRDIADIPPVLARDTFDGDLQIHAGGVVPVQHTIPLNRCVFVRNKHGMVVASEFKAI